jgi:hypothetical protein
VLKVQVSGCLRTRNSFNGRPEQQNVGHYVVMEMQAPEKQLSGKLKQLIAFQIGQQFPLALL